MAEISRRRAVGLAMRQALPHNGRSSKPVCLVFNDEKMLDAMSKSEWDALVAEHLAYDEFSSL